jgi:type I restriction enzyme M protein
MALKKSELYSSLWQSCDVLRGGMDASQYKDYVLVLLFIKYISDKYAGQPYAPISIPEGAGFRDLVKLKGNPHIGQLINTQIIAPLESANQLSDFPDFNDASKLGSGKEMVERLTDLIAVFENPALDFSSNRAEGDDLLGDAYEYLMRHFATESGKSKGQFYTPAEVSLVMAKVLGIRSASTSASTTAYDPTCGSGSLLLKVAAEAGTKITLYGQEMDAATTSLARMNMILHDNAEAEIKQGNTLADPKFIEGGKLQTFHYVVANFPFSVKRWSHGFDPLHDIHERFAPFGIPPEKQGDYAFLLHIVRSMKPTGKGACILPHGVLFRGNAEAEIRKNLIRRGYIQAIIGLPANLFYGTGIPACILVLDKEHAASRQGIFMIDASKGFLKDGNKNRLREQDIHKIVDTYTRQSEIPRYSRFVPLDEISDPKNDYNLNLPRYIDTTEPEDIQDIDGHLRGGIPDRDIDALQDYWKIMPALRADLFQPLRAGYSNTGVSQSALKQTILGHPEFAAFQQTSTRLFDKWKATALPHLKGFSKDGHPKALIETIAEDLLASFRDASLLDAYDVYQHLMDFWAATMQDDCYLIADDGWVAAPTRLIEKDKKGREKDKGWACDLVPKPLLVARYFAKEQSSLDAKQAELEAASAAIAELEEEHGGEEGFLGSLDKIAKAEVNARLKEIKSDKDAKDEAAVLQQWLKLNAEESELKKAIRDADAALDQLAYEKYPKLTEDEIRTLVIEDKWLATLTTAIQGELDRVSQTLTGRIRILAERYATTLPNLTDEVATLAAKVDGHLKKMGAAL